MKVLLVYPKYPDTFWSFKYALTFIAKRALHPPLGLLTVAAMLPGEWDRRRTHRHEQREPERPGFSMGRLCVHWCHGRPKGIDQAGHFQMQGVGR